MGGDAGREEEKGKVRLLQLKNRKLGRGGGGGGGMGGDAGSEKEKGKVGLLQLNKT